MPAVPCLRHPCPVMPRSARLLAVVCVVIWSADAMAQSAAVTDPLTPKLQTDPRNPPRFQQFSRSSLVQLGPPANFPASGAGITGFDSTNSRKKAKANIRAKSPANAQRNAQVVAPGLPVPTVVSP